MTTAPSHPNLDVVNQVFAAMAAGDRDALLHLHHPDVVLHVSGHGPTAGDYVGRDAVLGGRTATAETDTDDTVEVHDILWTPEHVVVLSHVTIRRDGDELQQNVAQVIHVDDDGLVHEIWEYLWDQQANQVFWSRH